MKVTVEGTAEELLELFTVGRTSRDAFRVPENTNLSSRDVRDEMPNRFREEGV